MEQEYQEVDFKTYCETCKHKETKEELRPCCYCLEHPVNLYSNKPVRWEEK